MDAYEKIKEDLARMNFLVDAIKKSQNKDHIKEAKRLRKDIKVQLNALKDEFESHETGLLDAITDE
jgi:hypothetical protein